MAFGLAGDVLSDNPPSSVDHGLEALLGCADAEGVGRSLLGDVFDGQGLSTDEDEEDDCPTMSMSTSSGLPSADEREDTEDAADARAQQQGETTAASTSTSASSSSFSATTTALSTSSARSSSSAAPSVSSSSLAPVPPLAATERSEFARSLGVREAHKHVFVQLAGNTALGTIYRIGPNGFKAICKVHGAKECSCYVTLKGGEAVEPVERVLMQWLSGAPGLSLLDHRARATELKLARGMRIRR